MITVYYYYSTLPSHAPPPPPLSPRQVYQQPLADFGMGVGPILPTEQVEQLFGPVSKLIGHHELFYSALTARTMDWGPTQCVGDIFMSSVSGLASSTPPLPSPLLLPQLLAPSTSLISISRKCLWGLRGLL